MKKLVKISYALILGTSLLSGCGKKNVVAEDQIIFDTGYESVVINPIKPNGGKINKPTINDPSVTVYGFYSDPLFQNEFDFNQNISEGLTIYLRALKGDGSESNPYLIESGLSLLTFTSLKSTITGIAKVTKSFAGYSYYSDDYAATTFNGTFLGQGNTIEVLFDENYQSNTGVFYKVGESGVVKDLTIKGNIEGVKASTGALCNFNYGTIDNIETIGTSYHTSNGCNNGVSLMTSFEEDGKTVVNDFGTHGSLATLEKGGAGGICGTNYGTIQNSINKMMVKATIGGGSMAGINYGTIVNCFNRGAIGTTGNYSVNSTQIRDPEFNESYLGGMAGANFGTIHQCVNANQVFTARLPWLFNNAPAGQNDFSNRIRIGGIAGYNFGTYETDHYTGGIITECLNVGRVHGDMQVGGIAGYSNGYISDCFSTAYMGGRSCVGTIVGWQGGTLDGSKIGVVKNCIGFGRVMKGTFPQTIQDADGNTFTGESLTDSSGGGSNVNEYYKTAKYASKCVYHNNSGNENPIDPETGSNTSISTTAIMSEAAYEQVNHLDDSNNNIWNYCSTDVCTAIAPFGTSWQVYLNVIPAWLVKTVTYVVDGASSSFKAVAGVLYVDNNAQKSSDKYTSSLNSNLSVVVPGRGLPSRAIDVPNGHVLKWTTVEGDANALWDGIVRNNITVYPIAVPME